MADKKDTKDNNKDTKTAKDSKDSKDKKIEKPLDLGLLEEDDEFEEFPAEVWKDKDLTEEEVNLWEDNWDDDNIEEDFSKQLKSELEKKSFV